MSRSPNDERDNWRPCDDGCRNFYTVCVRCGDIHGPTRVWIIMQNDSPIGVAFSEAAAQYQADSAQLQYPYLARRRGLDWQYPIGDPHDPGPYFYVRGPFTAGKLSAL